MKYSLEEIDFLRWGMLVRLHLELIRSGLDQYRVPLQTLSYDPRFYDASQEDKLRTLMQNGTTTQEMSESIRRLRDETNSSLGWPGKFQQFLPEAKVQS